MWCTGELSLLYNQSYNPLQNLLCRITRGDNSYEEDKRAGPRFNIKNKWRAHWKPFNIIRPGKMANIFRTTFLSAFLNKKLCTLIMASLKFVRKDQLSAFDWVRPWLWAWSWDRLCPGLILVHLTAKYAQSHFSEFHSQVIAKGRFNNVCYKFTHIVDKTSIQRKLKDSQWETELYMLHIVRHATK